MTAAPLDVPALIGHKRDGDECSASELRAFFAGYLAGTVAEEQMSAFLMAGVLRGFSTGEAIEMTEILTDSGDTVDLSALRGPVVDKHSTGGVGDTCTLVVAPILAACGAQVAKLSGRGLGHTGGTLDKLESIPGFTVNLSPGQLHDQVNDVGLAVAAATADLVPLDKRLYALRDVTGTVPSVALIAASVMSKKLAGGAGHIILDVKMGDGAFMREEAQAVELAELCVEIGRSHGRKTAALVSDMDQPLSRAIGNAIEVRHAIEVLNGQRAGRLRDLSVELSAAGLVLTGQDFEVAEAAAEHALESGAAAERFESMVVRQGGDPAVMRTPQKVLPAAPASVTVPSPGSGVVIGLACRELGLLAGGLGAGRQRKEDAVDPAVGIEMEVEVGSPVSEGQSLGVLHLRDDAQADWAAQQLIAAVTIGESVGTLGPLIRRRIAVEAS